MSDNWKFFQIENEDGILARGRIVRESVTKAGSERRFLVENTFTFPPGRRTNDFLMYAREQERSKKHFLGTVTWTKSMLHPNPTRVLALGATTPQFVVKRPTGEERRMRRRRFSK